MKKIIIAGGTGFLGQCLASHFTKQGHQVIILTRRTSARHNDIKYIQWDGTHLGTWCQSLDGAEMLINLAGKSVDCRYTESNKKKIYSSRLGATSILSQAILGLDRPPKLWINAASATIYRHAEDREMDEESGEIGDGFSVDVCQKWEDIFNNIDIPNTRKVILRTAIVLGKDGGALSPLKNLARLGIGGRQGSGKQYVSWLHEKDFVNIVDFIIENEGLSGVVNASSPNPITNRLFMKTLRGTLGIPFGINSPKWLLEIGALIIRTETELVLKSRRVVPKRLTDRGFRFSYPEIDKALAELCS
ncbi:MAG: TIGR01777 family oxidoreductase [Reichenbachiella sp.]|uniref:TIGR01777 family oxidoreductase n=1 Tax=Reichenbachiella sp. TaxID=2184521 RepID=UPI003267A04F